MSLLDNLPARIADANATINELNALIIQLWGQTLVPDGTTQLPTVDANGLWTFKQTTPNADSEFEGIYWLANSDDCYRIDDLTVVKHINPANNAAPARIKACGTASWVDQPTVQALTDQCFNQFAIRSAEDFEIQIKLTQCLPNTCLAYYNFALAAYAFTPTKPNTTWYSNRSGGTWVANVGWQSTITGSQAFINIFRQCSSFGVATIYFRATWQATIAGGTVYALFDAAGQVLSQASISTSTGTVVTSGSLSNAATAEWFGIHRGTNGTAPFTLLNLELSATPFP